MAAHTSSVSSTVKGYEKLINEQLQSELQKVLDARDKIHGRIAECLELRNNVKILQEQEVKTLKSLVNLGCDFYVQAKVDDTSWLIVDVGLGFRATMTLDEAANFATVREQSLVEQADRLTAMSTTLKAQIKLVLGAIDEALANTAQGIGADRR